MQKLIYTLWDVKPTLTAAMSECVANDITINMSQNHEKQMQGVPPLPDVVVSFWLNSAYNRSAVEAVMSAHSSRIAGYVVSPSQPLNDPAPENWFTQIAFLKKPEAMDRQDWLRIWLDEHTKVAIETQSTFYYAQNIVARCLDDDAPQWDAIIEERFPAAALTSDHAFFDAATDNALEFNRAAMMKSCARFIDFRAMNAIITTSRVIE